MFLSRSFFSFYKKEYHLEYFNKTWSVFKPITMYYGKIYQNMLL